MPVRALICAARIERGVPGLPLSRLPRGSSPVSVGSVVGGVVIGVLDAVRRDVYGFDSRWEIHQRTAKVHRLVGQGVPVSEIAPRVGMAPRNVERHKRKPFPGRPELISGDVSVQREAELEDVAELAAQLAASLRDENPLIVAGTLDALTRKQLQELCTVALAMVPVDRSLRELLSWVQDLGSG